MMQDLLLQCLQDLLLQCLQELLLQCLFYYLKGVACFGNDVALWIEFGIAQQIYVLRCYKKIIHSLKSYNAENIAVVFAHCWSTCFQHHSQTFTQHLKRVTCGVFGIRILIVCGVIKPVPFHVVFCTRIFMFITSAFWRFFRPKFSFLNYLCVRQSLLEVC